MVTVSEPPLLCTNSEGVYGNKSGYCSLHRDTLGCIATLTNHWLPTYTRACT